jgi:hypothetical protein
MPENRRSMASAEWAAAWAHVVTGSDDGWKMMLSSSDGAHATVTIPQPAGERPHAEC